MSILNKILGDANQKYLKSLEPFVAEINSLEPEFEKLPDEKLRGFSEELRKHIAEGGQLEGVLVRAFALVREAARRTLNQRHFDVQLMGGLAMHQGKIVEMKTGEGKTLAATLPAYLNALPGKGVHIITVNDYLARRDAVWMGQIYHLLGLTVGCINHENSYLYDPSHSSKNKEASGISNSKFLISKQAPNSNNRNELDKTRDELGSFKVVYEYLRPCSKKEAYMADITYGTNNEFGFDYLRDNLAQIPSQMSQRNEKEGGYNFAIVDEIDSILIDEARTPLIISAPDEKSGELYKTFARIAPRLKEGPDYTVDEKMKAVSITEQGIDKAESMLGIGDIYTEQGIKYVHHLEQALRAQALFHKDKDYVVRKGQIVIVDDFTGRLMPGRRWSDGLHQAVEAKEGVEVQKESRTIASITFQNYFRMYRKLAGMTGTAVSSAEEFHKVYDLQVAVIPTNRPLIRKDYPDAVFQSAEGKFKAAVAEIKKRHTKGQPILVGTVSIEKNEYLSALLKREGVEHKVLNAKNHEQDGEIIAQAGRVGAVTVATNIAGRGVDIVLGGNPPDKEAAEKVRAAGGLFVLGTERHEARRIDNQLRGRAGRQGDPGETQFFVSMEDDLMRIFGSDKIKNMMGTFGVPEDQPIQNKMISRAIESAQAKIEGFNFDARKHILEYDDVLNKQRSSVYSRRNKILFAEPKDLEEQVLAVLEEELDFIVDAHTSGDIDQWDKDEIFANMKNRFGVEEKELKDIEAGLGQENEPEKLRSMLRSMLRSIIKKHFDKRRDELGQEAFVNLLRAYYLQIIDMVWMQHLEVMEYMRSSVRLRAYGQRDPLVEYKREGLRLFKELNGTIRAHLSHIALRVANLPKQKEQPRLEARPLSAKTAPRRVAQERGLGKKVGRNDPCPCGSGKKYKKCHMTQG